MPTATHSLGSLIQELHRQHPRLVVLVGSRHSSRESHKLEKELAAASDVTFLEQPCDTAPLNREQALRALAAPASTGYHPEDIATLETLSVAKQPVYIDQPVASRKPLTVAAGALRRFVEENRPDNDPVVARTLAKAKRLSHGRARDSNRHMAGRMAAELDRRFAGGEPFLAVALLGQSHVLPERYGNAGTDADIKKRLNDSGYEVVTINIAPVRDPAPRERDGDYTLETGHTQDPSVDYTLRLIDRGTQFLAAPAR